MSSELYIGVMSGTSLDGVDITLCEIDDSTCQEVSSFEYLFDKELKDEILNMISGSTTLEQVGTLNTKLGNLFADSINSFIKLHDIDTKKVKAIGLHGQTLWHSPHAKSPFSMQLGCPNVVSAKTGITVVADFRSMDIANGGEGAPFAPAFHQFIFGDIKEITAVLNIGGMANITLLSNELKGWDTGVGNALMDYWIQTCKNTPYDKYGEFAAKGNVNQELLDNFLNDDYFQKTPPKSTGREYFNATWLSNHMPTFQTITDEDIQRTLLELTAVSIARDIEKTNITLLIVCGGGTKNSLLMKRLKELCKMDVKVSDELGVSSDFMEAMAFSWLAYKRIHRSEVNLSSVTGSKKNSILGGIYG
ncbi:anhydro-N-acetylmuramic acid kinase [Sulfurimonas sp.]